MKTRQMFYPLVITFSPSCSIVNTWCCLNLPILNPLCYCSRIISNHRIFKSFYTFPISFSKSACFLLYSGASPCLNLLGIFNSSVIISPFHNFLVHRLLLSLNYYSISLLFFIFLYSLFVYVI